MDSETRKFEKLGAVIASGLGSGPTAERREAQHRALMRFVAVRRTPRRRWVILAPIAAGALAAGLAILVWPVEEQPFPFWTGSELRAGAEGQILRVPAHQHLPIRFPDGSSIEIDGGSTGQVTASKARRVSFTLERGQVRVSIRRKKVRRWTVAAGPYAVEALGTQFSVSWRRFDLGVAVSEGRVRVTGPGLERQGVVLDPRDRLLIKGQKELSLVRAIAPLPSADPPRDEDRADALAVEPMEPQALDSQPPGPPLGDLPPEEMALEDEDEPAAGLERSDRTKTAQKRRGRSGRRRSAALQRDRWKALYEQGRYQAAVAAARDVGYGQLLRELELSELWQLAEAARYAGVGPDAQKTLLAIRRRFPGAGRARIASFLLGRVAMDQLKKPEEAAAWFRVYLVESPEGSLAEEALGRLISAYQRSGRHRDAIRAAKIYLRRYPEGVFSALAQAVVKK